MTKKVLIAYGSRSGSTEEISIKFKENLEEKGFTVDLVNLKSKNKPDVHNYSGLLIGSGIRIGRWTKYAKNFLKANVKDINDKKMVVGIFLSSGEASDPEKRPEAIEKYLEQVFNTLELDLGDHILYDAFGGVFDLSETSKLSWFNKKILRMVAAEDPNIVLNEKNDLRDWDQIHRFLDRFIERIQ
ncbi:MAG: flavodoxin domain-containing protein [Candidatus Hermodarchaeota archaeon]